MAFNATQKMITYLKLLEAHMDNKGKYICNGYVRTTDGIIETEAYAKVSLIIDIESSNYDRPYYCEVEYEDNDGIKWVKKIFANDPFSAFELGVDFIHSIISPFIMAPKFKLAKDLGLTNGVYNITGFVRARDKITNIKSYGKVEMACETKPYNSDLQFYCAVEYKGENGDAFKRDLFANNPHSAFELGVKFINSIIAYHNGFPEND
ncbi:hypothetical protein [Pseudaquidulcibacter saccharophilus]|uniref:hypothetical protein n=1 Tax=Pseudaquidulcibacter saccharophilus TaxID=2831900 RepID=UPI001EFF1B89|nr:hypothetical protein [Pseudaquidulcibacter saccharophilus]